MQKITKATSLIEDTILKAIRLTTVTKVDKPDKVSIKCSIRTVLLRKFTLQLFNGFQAKYGFQAKIPLGTEDGAIVN